MVAEPERDNDASDNRFLNYRLRLSQETRPWTYQAARFSYAPRDSVGLRCVLRRNFVPLVLYSRRAS